MKQHALIFLLALVLGISACKRKVLPEPEPDVLGCMDPNALNYNPQANIDNASCEYPDAYLPLKAGNVWTLEDMITIPLLGDVTVTAVFRMTKDTTINSVDYVISEETIGIPTIFEQADRYAYRMAKTGEVYRADLNAAEFEELLFLEYPHEAGITWEGGTVFTGMFVSTGGSVTVPAGSFNEVTDVQFTDLQTSQATTISFGRDSGILKAVISVDLQLTVISVEAELISFSLN